MKVTLIITDDDSRSVATKTVWQNACANQNIELYTYPLDNKNGRAIARTLDLKTFPSLILNDRVIAVGHPDRQTAEGLISKLSE